MNESTDTTTQVEQPEATTTTADVAQTDIPKAQQTTHNHLTRAILNPGECPACDDYWERNDGIF